MYFDKPKDEQLNRQTCLCCGRACACRCDLGRSFRESLPKAAAAPACCHRRTLTSAAAASDEPFQSERDQCNLRAENAGNGGLAYRRLRWVNVRGDLLTWRNGQRAVAGSALSRLAPRMAEREVRSVVRWHLRRNDDRRRSILTGALAKRASAPGLQSSGVPAGNLRRGRRLRRRRRSNSNVRRNHLR